MRGSSSRPVSSVGYCPACQNQERGRNSFRSNESFFYPTFIQLSRLNTGPTDLLHPAPDVRLLPPAGLASGLVASLYPGRNLTSWITTANFIEAANLEFQGYGFSLARRFLERTPSSCRFWPLCRWGHRYKNLLHGRDLSRSRLDSCVPLVSEI